MRACGWSSRSRVTRHAPRHVSSNERAVGATSVQTALLTSYGLQPCEQILLRRSRKTFADIVPMRLQRTRHDIQGLRDFVAVEIETHQRTDPNVRSRQRRRACGEGIQKSRVELIEQALEKRPLLPGAAGHS